MLARLSRSAEAGFFVALLAAGGITLFGQATQAELFGVVLDATGLPIQSASVELTNNNTGLRFVAGTSAGGNYRFVTLPAGTYQISVVKQGFTPLRGEGIVLRVGDQVPLDLPLQIGDFAQALEVTAEAPLLQPAR